MRVTPTSLCGASATRRLLLCGFVFFLAACGESRQPAQAQAASPRDSTATVGRTQPDQTARPAGASGQPAGGLLDACSLLTKAEVEAGVGRPVLAPQKEEAANLVICNYGDPTAPTLQGRPLSQVLSISVFVGSDAQYYAGAAAQARDSFEQGRKNAASVQPVPGLGDDAYWDQVFRTLNVLKGKYEVEVTVGSDVGGMEVARAFAAKVLPRLP